MGIGSFQLKYLPVYTQEVSSERVLSFTVTVGQVDLIPVDFRIKIRRRAENGGTVTYDNRFSRSFIGLGYFPEYNFQFSFRDNKSTFDITGTYSILRDPDMIVDIEVYDQGGSTQLAPYISAPAKLVYVEPTTTTPITFNQNSAILSIPNNPILDTSNNNSFSASAVFYPNEPSLIGKTVIGFCQIKEANGVVTKLIQKSFTVLGGSQNVIFTTTGIASNSTHGEVYVWLSLADPTPITTQIPFTIVYPTNTIPTGTIPTAPTLSSSSSGSGLIHLSWTGTNPVDIERADSINGYSVLIGSLSSSSIDYDLGSSAQTYFFRVRSKNSIGYSNYSNVITFEVVGSTSPTTGTIPNPPVLTSSTYGITDSGIINALISWLPISGATSYNIEAQSPTQSNYSSFGDSNYNDIGDGSGKIGVSVPINSGNGNYLFRVRAKNSYGYSYYSNVIVITRNVVTTTPPPETVPNPPVFEIINSFSDLQKLLKWNKVTGISIYNIESSSPVTDPLWISVGGDFEVNTTNDLQNGQWGVNVVKGIIDGIWKYRIRAKNSVGYSNYSNIVSYTIGGTNPNPDPIRKDLISKVSGIFTMLLGLSLLGKQK